MPARPSNAQARKATELRTPSRVSRCSYPGMALFGRLPNPHKKGCTLTACNVMPKVIVLGTCLNCGSQPRTIVNKQAGPVFTGLSNDNREVKIAKYVEEANSSRQYNADRCIDSFDTARRNPEHLRRREGIDSPSLPPGDLVSGVMIVTVMDSAQRYGELVADLESHRARLGEPQMVGVGGASSTDQTGLRGNARLPAPCFRSATFGPVRSFLTIRVRLSIACPHSVKRT
jgi:hypothetical protein